MPRLLNILLDNAVKYTRHGSVVVTAEKHGPGRVRIEVRDTGPGISEESLPRIFERFYRVDRGRSRELGGTGLGLSIARHAVEIMRGELSVESRVGAGSTFRIDLEPGGG